jgi:hypothetical protein
MMFFHAVILCHLSAVSSSLIRNLQSTEGGSAALAPVPGDDQGIRGGFSVEAIPWFVVFEGTPLCGGVLIQSDIVSMSASWTKIDLISWLLAS